MHARAAVARVVPVHPDALDPADIAHHNCKVAILSAQDCTLVQPLAYLTRLDEHIVPPVQGLSSRSAVIACQERLLVGYSGEEEARRREAFFQDLAKDRPVLTAGGSDMLEAYRTAEPQV
ncbi:unnamed protein product [Clonostachys rosea f. rosea IK726]|jgi:hypothetical protein|uniref:Uncharacterized protein n=1 Tax=Clonostachys rosea f. rosea IK726 TaxID=1349383 RepID=A0ACA9T7E2_BIOOC|nr:unnamed protein product [Clonostachys rosea f. rosea IK726]